jgi:cytidylate kinase
VRHADGSMRVALNGTDVTQEIRTQAVGTMASQISTLRAVREKLVKEQRRIGHAHDEATGGVVLDGRDTGTVVFPNADLKVFMTADLEERARRRQAQYAEKGRDVPLSEVSDEIHERDKKDQERALAPLRKADDAIVLDTTNKNIEDQVAFVVDHVKARQRQGTSVSASD